MEIRIRVYNKPLVKAPYPSGFIGDGLTRLAVLELPTATLRRMLPSTLDLGEQRITAAGTHPVIVQCHSFLHCQFSFPTYLPPMKFHEQTFGIPFTRIRGGDSSAYLYMPKLYLDDPWVMIVGRNLWGFDKELANVAVADDNYTVTNFAGRRLLSLTWHVEKEMRPAVGGYPEFDEVRSMLSQPLLSLWPAALGPLLTVTDFDRRWHIATVRPMHAALQLDGAYARGLDTVSFGDGSGESSLAGAYELSAQWWLSYPFPAPASFTEPGVHGRMRAQVV